MDPNNNSITTPNVDQIKATTGVTFVVSGTNPIPASAYTFRTMALREVRDYTQHLAGRIKTIVDAAISDPQQNKAVKNLVHDAFWTEHYEAVHAWADIATERHMTPTTEATQCIPGFPFATDHKLPASS